MLIFLFYNFFSCKLSYFTVFMAINFLIFRIFRLFIFLFGGEEAGGGDVAVEDVAEGG